MTQESTTRAEARNDFDKARRKALRSELRARILGRENRLIPFDEVRAELRQQNPLYRGLHQVSLDAIIGSVGRYRDFNRQFLPLTDNMRDRWVNVQSLTAASGWAPVELYKVGDAYFVRDGNHRTAIARQMGNRTIEAQVWEFPSLISLANAQSLDEALIALGSAEFEQKTQIDDWAPGHDIRFTVPGRYSELFIQIADIRHKIGKIDRRDVSFEEAAQLWYDLVYLPTITIIEASELTNAFPGRTPADLFVWLSIHRSQLGELYGDYQNLTDLATMLIERYRPAGVGKMTQQVRNLLGANSKAHLTDVDEVKNDLGLNNATTDGGHA